MCLLYLFLWIFSCLAHFSISELFFTFSYNFKIYLYINILDLYLLCVLQIFINLSAVFWFCYSLFIMFFCHLLYIIRWFPFFSFLLFHSCMWIWNHSSKNLFLLYCLLSTWSNISVALPAFLVLPFAWNTFDSPALLNQSLLGVSWIEYQLCLYEPTWKSFHLIGKFNPCTFVDKWICLFSILSEYVIIIVFIIFTISLQTVFAMLSQQIIFVVWED